jgi:hypothetical protein
LDDAPSGKENFHLRRNWLDKKSLRSSFYRCSIKAAFAESGIHPFNRFAIPEYFFAPAQVTDLATGKLELHLIKLVFPFVHSLFLNQLKQQQQTHNKMFHRPQVFNKTN